MKTTGSAILLLTAFAAFPFHSLKAQVPVDRDGDGHSDLWQLFHGIPAANGNEDSDGVQWVPVRGIN